MPGLPGRCWRPEHLVEDHGDHAAVHAGRRALVLVVEPGPASRLAVLPSTAHTHRRCHGVGEADDRAGGEESWARRPDPAGPGDGASALPAASSGGHRRHLRRGYGELLVGETASPPWPADPPDGRQLKRGSIGLAARRWRRGRGAVAAEIPKSETPGWPSGVIAACTRGCASRRRPSAPRRRPRRRRRASRSRARTFRPSTSDRPSVSRTDPQDRLHRQGAVGADDLGDLERLVQGLAVGDDPADQPDPQGLVGRSPRGR